MKKINSLIRKLKIKDLLQNKIFQKVLIFSILLFAIFWAGKGIFKYNVFSTHDGNHHLSRSYDVVKTIREGHFPLRWAGSLNYFCGVPIYNFFYPLIYYMVALIDYIHPDVILALKIIDFLSLLIGTLFFYFWMKIETKKEIPSLGGALLYLYAPYRFSLIFVRGSPEFLAYAILPVVLYFYSLLLSNKEEKNIYYAFGASVTGALLALSHNFTVMFLFPIILVYLIAKVFSLKSNILKIKWLVFSFLSSFGLASFFIGPAILEKKYTKIGENFLMWQEHFPTLGQLIRSPWGYFYSSLGTINDGMSFMLGYAHWVVLFLGFGFVGYMVYKRKFDLWIVLTLLLSIFVIYLILPVSMPFWEKVPMLQEIQFSWRLLGVAVFSLSSLFSFILAKIENNKILWVIFMSITLLGYVGNRNHLLPQPVSVEDVYKYDDYEKLHPHRHSTTTLGDDVIAKGAEKACWFEDKLISVNNEKVDFKVVEQGNTYGFIKFNLPKLVNQETAEKYLKLRVGYFPGAFEFELNGQKIDSYMCSGVNCFNIQNIKTQENTISWKVVQTPTQKMFNNLSLAFVAIWLIIFLLKFIDKDGKNKKYWLLLLTIFGLFVFFRSYNLSGRLGFGWDQERDSIAVSEILNGDIKLIGPRVYGPTGFFLPPYFFYILTPFYLVNNLSPFSGGSFIISFSILFFILSNVVLSKVFDRKTALIFSLLWALNSFAVSVDTIAWNPIFIPLLFLLNIYLSYLILKSFSIKKIFLLGLLFGLGISFHLQFFFVFPLIFVVFYHLYKINKLKYLFWFAIGFVIVYLPILVFDLKHDFLNIKQIFLFDGFGGNSVNRLLPVWSNVIASIFGGKPNIVFGLLIYFASLIGYLTLYIKENETEQKYLYLGLFLTVLVSLPIFRFLIKNPSEYYFNYLLIPIFILLAITLKKLNKMGLILIVLIAIYFGFKSLPQFNDANLGLKQKNNAIVFLSKITKDTQSFNVSFDVPFNEDSGFRYLLKYNNVPVSGKDNDPLIEIVLPSDRKETTFIVGRIGILIPKGFINDNWLGKM